MTTEDARVSFFAFDMAINRELESRYCIHFPLMMSVLAGLREERRKSETAIWTSIAAVILSFIAIVISATGSLLSVFGSNGP